MNFASRAATKVVISSSLGKVVFEWSNTSLCHDKRRVLPQQEECNWTICPYAGICQQMQLQTMCIKGGCKIGSVDGEMWQLFDIIHNSSHSLCNSWSSGSSHSVWYRQSFCINNLLCMVTGVVNAMGLNTFEDSCKTSCLVVKFIIGASSFGMREFFCSNVPVDSKVVGGNTSVSYFVLLCTLSAAAVIYNSDWGCCWTLFNTMVRNVYSILGCLDVYPLVL